MKKYQNPTMSIELLTEEIIRTSPTQTPDNVTSGWWGQDGEEVGGF